MKNPGAILSLCALVLSGLAAGCAGTVGSDSVVSLTGSVVKNGQVIGGSVTIASNSIGAGVNYSAPGTNFGISIVTPLASATNK
jgi:hypothetical protein